MNDTCNLQTNCDFIIGKSVENAANSPAKLTSSQDFHEQVSQLLSSVQECHRKALMELDTYAVLIRNSTALFKQSFEELYNKKHKP